MRLARALAAALLLTGGLCIQAQRHEVGLTLGVISAPGRNSPSGSVSLARGVALQANYGYRLAGFRKAVLIPEVHFLANPLRQITSPGGLASRDVATLYVVPGVRVRFRPMRSFSPYLAAGGGYALYEQSLTRIDGAPNAAPRHTHRSTLGIGGGADFPVWRFVGGRVEVRDFYTGNPSFNVPVSGGQHNLVVGGGLILRLGAGER